MTKQILDFLTTHTFHNSWEFFNNQAGTLVTALAEGQPWLLGWRWAGGVNGAFRLVRENEAGQPIEVVLVINEPESERPKWESLLDPELKDCPCPVTLVMAGKKPVF